MWRKYVREVKASEKLNVDLVVCEKSKGKKKKGVKASSKMKN